MTREEMQKELNDVRQELLNRPDQYITFKDLVERFDDIDAYFNHSPWNLLQIYSNFDVLIGEESASKELTKELKQEPKTGRWIDARTGRFFKDNVFRCSECDDYIDFNGLNGGRGHANFCPSCGAKMEAE